MYFSIRSCSIQHISSQKVLLKKIFEKNSFLILKMTKNARKVKRMSVRFQFVEVTDQVKSGQFHQHCLNQWFSTSGPRNSGGPQNSLGGPLGFSHFIKNHIFWQTCHKNYLKIYLISKKISRNNKIILPTLRTTGLNHSCATHLTLATCGKWPFKSGEWPCFQIIKIGCFLSKLVHCPV